MKVDLFAPCLVDRFLPSIGDATVELLESVDVEVRFDPRQTCCGQPAFNGGYPEEALRFARRFLEVFGESDAVVCPSGSCVSMIREHYGLLGLSDEELLVWKRLRRRIFEVSEFLAVHDLMDKVHTRLPVRALVHYTCHHLRHIGAQSYLLSFLDQVEGLERLDAEEAVQCCGFGGVFSVKLPELSIAMARDRLKRYLEFEPDVIVLADAGCILQMQGVLDKMGVENPPPVIHYVELFTASSVEDLRR